MACDSGRRVQHGKLIVVGTPIGNLGDISPRAAQAFRSADAICCEDTRVTAKLLAHLGVERPLLRCDEHVIAARADGIVSRMQAGETIAYASDAGMPGVSDPGQVLVDAARDVGVPVEVIPGPVACVTALVASGLPCDHFFFEGFLPRKPGERIRRLSQLAAVPGALLFYESPHRTVDTLAAMCEVFPKRAVALCRELTKIHEEVVRGSVHEVYEEISAREQLKGEIVIVIAPPSDEEAAAMSGEAGAGCLRVQEDREEALRRDIACALAEGEPASAIAKRLSQRYSRKRREVYALVVSQQQEQGHGA